jgi:hypothetical protein
MIEIDKKVMKNMSTKESISIIIFGKNVGVNFIRTYETVVEACEMNNNFNFEIVVIDDYSRDFIPWKNVSKFKTIFQGNQLKGGIAGTILTGIKHCNFSKILLVPGHDVWTSESLSIVIRGTQIGDQVIGYRQNLAEERPVFKQIASRGFRAIYRQFGYYFVADPHGLHLFLKQDLENFLNEDDGHAFAVQMLANTIPIGRKLVQVPVFIKNNHKKRDDRSWKDSFPNPKNVLKVFISILFPRKIYTKVSK